MDLIPKISIQVHHTGLACYNRYVVFDKIKNLSKLPYFQQLRDTRALGLVVFGVIAIMVTWSGIKSVQTNYGLQKQISALQQQNQVQQLQNNNLQLQNEYLNTNQFLELSARQDFGLGAPGEQELLVPKSVALAHTVNLGQASVSPQTATVNQSTYQRNWQAWINFFLHRPSSN